MNLDDYAPSKQIEDRRRKNTTLPPASYEDPQGREPTPSLLDMLWQGYPGINDAQLLRSYTTPAGGLAQSAGYNQIGRQPMPIAPYHPPAWGGSAPRARAGYSGYPLDYPLIPSRDE